MWIHIKVLRSLAGRHRNIKLLRCYIDLEYQLKDVFEDE